MICPQHTFSRRRWQKKKRASKMSVIYAKEKNKTGLELFASGQRWVIENEEYWILKGNKLITVFMNQNMRSTKKKRENLNPIRDLICKPIQLIIATWVLWLYVNCVIWDPIWGWHPPTSSISPQDLVPRRKKLDHTGQKRTAAYLGQPSSWIMIRKVGLCCAI